MSKATHLASQLYNRENTEGDGKWNLQLMDRCNIWGPTGCGRLVFLLHMSTQRVIFEDTLDTCYADDIGLSCDLRLVNIENVTSTEEEEKQLEDWTIENHMLLNGKKSVKLRICFSQNPPQTAPLIIGGQAVPVGKAHNNKASNRTTNSLGNNILTRH